MGSALPFGITRGRYKKAGADAPALMHCFSNSEKSEREKGLEEDAPRRRAGGRSKHSASEVGGDIKPRAWPVQAGRRVGRRHYGSRWRAVVDRVKKIQSLC